MWKKSGAKTGLKDAVNKTVTNTLVANYKKSKKTPEDFYKVNLLLVGGQRPCLESILRWEWPGMHVFEGWKQGTAKSPKSYAHNERIYLPQLFTFLSMKMALLGYSEAYLGACLENVFG
eukprot:1175949-Prorocentrum_minimum.AAC.7